ncbi:MAG: ketoacyl-ACP synthase III [Nitrospinae bacterium]|nr:ketoacyl-ACP synthase III [Nitrospinota bacterium]
MARVAGLGMNVPERILSNADLEKMVDTTDEWIITRTGIKERRIADNGVSASQLAIPAALEALERAGVAPAQLDMIICATSTPDMMFPSTACFIQNGIGARGCAAFDLLAACSGFVYGLTVADKFIKSGAAKNILLVSSEIFSHIVDWKDRSTCVLFGDGAAAAVITAGNGPSGVMDSRIFADGSYGDLLYAGVGSANPAHALYKDGATQFVKMKGNNLFKIAVTLMADVCRSILADNGLTAEDVSIVIPHQANVRIINAVAKALGMPEEKLFVNVQKYGNTSAVTVPLAMYEAQKEGRLREGDLVLLVAFGGGLTWGASLLRW